MLNLVSGLINDKFGTITLLFSESGKIQNQLDKQNSKFYIWAQESFGLCIEASCSMYTVVNSYIN